MRIFSEYCFKLYRYEIFDNQKKDHTKGYAQWCGLYFCHPLEECH